MKYISIGAVMTEGTEHILDVCRGSRSYHLTGELASVWLNGRFGFAAVKKPTEEQALLLLLRMGLAIQTDGSSMSVIGISCFPVRRLSLFLSVVRLPSMIAAGRNGMSPLRLPAQRSTGCLSAGGSNPCICAANSTPSNWSVSEKSVALRLAIP